MQFIRFSLVGVLNTLIDIVAFNLFMLCFPARDVALLVVYNSLAYALGALNSYTLNKYWTFQRRQDATGREVMRFVIVSVCGILCNNLMFWLVAGIAHPSIGNIALWANIAKVIAISGTMTLSYLGMRLWVFAGTTRTGLQYYTRIAMKQNCNVADKGVMHWTPTASCMVQEESELMYEETDMSQNGNAQQFLTHHSLSVVLPAHNEEAVIATTLQVVLSTLPLWVQNFEVIVVNDGSTDNTQSIVQTIAATDPHVRLITHPVNQGYGAALVTGFTAVTKDLAFFMDADGQFDLHDLEPFFSLIDTHDAVLGYRIDRQDTWLRKCNAWGWRLLVTAIFKIRVLDVDCAFKLYRSEFLHKHQLETRGAMINAEMLYKMKRFGYTYTQLGVRHLPRKSGLATGAKLSVIVRAFHELFTYAQKWHHEEQQEKVYTFEINHL